MTSGHWNHDSEICALQVLVPQSAPESLMNVDQLKTVPTAESQIFLDVGSLGLSWWPDLRWSWDKVFKNGAEMMYETVCKKCFRDMKGAHLHVRTCKCIPPQTFAKRLANESLNTTKFQRKRCRRFQDTEKEYISTCTRKRVQIYPTLDVCKTPS